MNTKTTLVLAVVAVVVAGYLFLVAKPWDQPDKPETPVSTAKALFDPKPKDIDRVELTGRGGTIVFNKQNETWNIVEPVNSPAAEFEVNALVDRVADLKYLKAYPKGDSNRPKDSVAGLDEPAAVVKLFKGDKLEAELAVGDRLPTGKGTYVRLASDDRILESQTDLSNSFDKRLESFRDKRLLKFELKDVKRVKVEGLQNFELAQANDNWMVETPVRGRADRAAAEKVVRPLTTLSAQEFKDDKPISLKPYGLDRPRLTVRIETSKQILAKAKPGDADTKPADTQPSTEEKSYVLLIGGATDTSGNAYFAKLESAPWVFSLMDSTIKELAPAFSELHDKQLIKIESTADVTRIEAETPSGQVVLTKPEKGGWTLADGSQADTSAVDDLLKAVQNLRASNFADAADTLVPFNWDKPRAKVTITKRGDANPATLLVGEETSSGKMTYVRNAAEAAVGVVLKSEVDPLLSPAVAYQDRQVMSFQRDHANRIEIARAGKPNVVLAKEGGVWSMQEPISGVADGDAARNLVADLASLRAKRVVDSGNKEKYGLSQPGLTVRVQTQAPPPPRPKTQPAATQPAATQPVISGAPQATQPEAAAESQPAAPPPQTHRIMLSEVNGVVYACREDRQLVYELDKKIYEDAGAEMYDRQILKFEVAQVSELTVEHDTTRITLRKSGSDWKYTTDPMLPIDSQKVIDVLNAFRDLKTHRYVAYVAEDLAKYGLDKDVSRVAVGMTDGKKVEVLLSKTGPDNDTDKSRYAVLAGTKRVFLLKGDQATKFAQKLEDFEKSAAKPGQAAPSFGGGPNEAPPPSFGE